MVSYEELDAHEKSCEKEFGRLVKQKRGKMAIYRLARIAKVSETTIRKVESGNGCSWGIAARLCKVLNITIMIL